MNERQATWGEVTSGMYVKDKVNVTWRIDGEREGRLLLVRPGADDVVVNRPPDGAPVMVLEPTEDEALALVSSGLGAVVMATHEQGAAFVTCPPLIRRLDVIHTHFFMMHGIWTKSGPNSRSLSILLEQHRDDHLTEPHVSHAWIEHRHH